ncbi:ATP-binding protein [Asanoa iriomotensis]|uniref:ATP-binding protein n=1 Tax=Asanoa iriomotensis TaxID=234613 RepID=UPI001944649D|nr:ATP-binding protein [Asanoa iriomotensis]
MAPQMTSYLSASTVGGPLRERVTAYLKSGGFEGERAEDFVAAVNEIAVNAVRHGGGTGHLEMTIDTGVVTCRIEDRGGLTSPPRIHLPEPGIPGGRGLWIASQLADSLRLAADGRGLSVTISSDLGPEPRIDSDDVLQAADGSAEQRTAR